MRLLILLCAALGVSQADYVMDLVKHTYHEHAKVYDHITNTYKSPDSPLLGRRDLLGDFKTLGHLALDTLKENALAALGTGLPGFLPIANLLGKREVSTRSKFAELVKEEAEVVLQKVEEIIKDAKHVAQGLEQLLQQGAVHLLKGDDVRQLAQKVLTFLTDSFQSLINKDTFEVDLENLFEKIIPNAVSKMTHVMSRRGLLGDLLTNGLKDTLTDITGLAGQVLGGVKPFVDNLLTGAKAMLQPHIDNIKALATNFLSQAGTLTAQAAAKAVKFFQPFAAILGPLFDKVKAVASKFMPGVQNLLG